MQGVPFARGSACTVIGWWGKSADAHTSKHWCVCARAGTTSWFGGMRGFGQSFEEAAAVWGTLLNVRPLGRVHCRGTFAGRGKARIGTQHAPSGDALRWVLVQPPGLAEPAASAEEEAVGP